MLRMVRSLGARTKTPQNQWARASTRSGQIWVHGKTSANRTPNVGLPPAFAGTEGGQQDRGCADRADAAARLKGARGLTRRALASMETHAGARS